VVLNLSAADSQGMLRVPWPTLAGRRWIARDLLSGEQAEHAGDDLVAGTMTVQLPAWGAKLIEVVGQ
jgi:hypothetical protein